MRFHRSQGKKTFQEGRHELTASDVARTSAMVRTKK